MLARGAICRLAADVPKTSTHDLPRLANLLRSSRLARNALSLPQARALSRAYRVVLSEYRRSYATTAQATKPTPRVKRDVKAAAAKKPVKKATAKKPAPKKPARKPAKRPAKKAAAKKAKPRPKKVVTPEEKKQAKDKARIKELKALALMDAPSSYPLNSWLAFTHETLRSRKGSTIEANRAALTEAAAKYKTITPAEKEHYNHLALESSGRKKAEYDAWIKAHTPEQIRLANLARRNLKRRISMGEKIPIQSAKLKLLRDDRQIKRPSSAYNIFVSERQSSGDFKGIAMADGAKLIANEWKALSDSEKEKYLSQQVAARTAYKQEMMKTYGHE